MPKKPERDILYNKVEVRVFEPSGDLLGEEEAKLLLGWTEPEDGDTFDNYLFKDIQGNTIYCSNNDLQRPFYQQTATDLMWDILGGNWEFNLETIIIGETGLVLDGKHRLISLVLACQEYNRNPDRYPSWKNQPEISIIVGLGAKETKRLVNTIGTGKPRSLADSFYASGIFDTTNKTELKKLCRLAEHTVRMLWIRTNAQSDAYNARFSHSDALEFIERHPGVLECIQTLHTESKGKQYPVSQFAGAYAPALLYLMSVSSTSYESYKNYADPPTEEGISFYQQELAERYWLELTEGSENVIAVIKYIQKLADQGNMRSDERVAIIVKGWNAYASNSSVSYEDLQLEVETDENGIRNLLEDPTVGGIDLGSNPEDSE